MQTEPIPTQFHEDRSSSRNVPGLDRALLGLIKRAGRDPGLTPSNKAVLLAVIAHADGNGVCTDTDRSLARASDTSVPTVQRALKLFEDDGVIGRVYRPGKVREIRLITGEQSLVVVDLYSLPDRKINQQQQPYERRDCSPESTPLTAEPTRPECEHAHIPERLIELLTARKVTAKVARGLVRDFPERIIPQVQAHRHRSVRDPAASLVTAIRENWATDPPKPQPTAKEAKEEARKVQDAERQAAVDAQEAFNTRKRGEAEKVRNFWEGLSEAQKEAFDEEAVEASNHRDEFRNLSPDSPVLRCHRVAARWEHVRRKLGLPPEPEQ
jgi:hypothetical protein